MEAGKQIPASWARVSGRRQRAPAGGADTDLESDQRLPTQRRVDEPIGGRRACQRQSPAAWAGLHCRDVNNAHGGSRAIGYLRAARV